MSSAIPNYFYGFKPKLDDTAYQFDWTYLNSLNADVLRESNNEETYENIIHSYIDAKFGNVEMQFFPFPLSRKFFEIMQLSIRFLVNKIMKLNNTIKMKNDEIEYMRHKYAKTIQKVDSLPQTILAKDVVPVHSCPVCGRFFKAMMYLDKHFNKEHLEYTDAWSALRHNTPYGVSREAAMMRNDIDDIRACVTRQNLEEAKVYKGKGMNPFVKKKTQKKQKVLTNQRNTEKIPSNGGTVTHVVKIEPKGNIGEFISSVIDSSPGELSSISSLDTENLLNKIGRFGDGTSSAPLKKSSSKSSFGSLNERVNLQQEKQETISSDFTSISPVSSVKSNKGFSSSNSKPPASAPQIEGDKSNKVKKSDISSISSDFVSISSG